MRVKSVEGSIAQAFRDSVEGLFSSSTYISVTPSYCDEISSKQVRVRGYFAPGREVVCSDSISMVGRVRRRRSRSLFSPGFALEKFSRGTSLLLEIRSPMV